MCLYVFSVLLLNTVQAHGISGKDAHFLQENNGQAIGVFIYLGAKHMITGYDHLLYLCGVIFFLYKLREVALFVSLFALGHSITLLSGVLIGLKINPYIIDAIIGLSVAYKALENLDGLKSIISKIPNPKLAVFVFGLIHGLGLATKIQDMTLSDDGLVTNILSFNAISLLMDSSSTASPIFIVLNSFKLLNSSIQMNPALIPSSISCLV